VKKPRKRGKMSKLKLSAWTIKEIVCSCGSSSFKITLKHFKQKTRELRRIILTCAKCNSPFEFSQSSFWWDLWKRLEVFEEEEVKIVKEE